MQGQSVYLLNIPSRNDTVSNEQWLILFGFLFKPSSDHASFRIKEESYSRRNIKMGTRLFPVFILKRL